MGTKIQIIPKIRIENQRYLPKSGDSMAESDFFFDFSPYYRHFFEKKYLSLHQVYIKNLSI